MLWDVDPNAKKDNHPDVEADSGSVLDAGNCTLGCRGRAQRAEGHRRGHQSARRVTRRPGHRYTASMTFRVAVAATLVALLPLSARANGGPVAWTGPTGTGGIAPVENSTIRLVSEHLLIRLFDDGGAFDVEADYVLSNPGPAKRLLYGVPVDFGPGGGGDDTPKERAKAIAREEAYPGAISIAVGRSRYRCAVRDRHTLKVENDWFQERVVGWCVAEIEIPEGRSALVLRYRGSLDYTDASYSKSVYTVFGKRSLRYELAPAGYWAGGGASVELEIDRGIWAPFFRLERPAQGWVEERGGSCTEATAWT